jgi:hypothetical protein
MKKIARLLFPDDYIYYIFNAFKLFGHAIYKRKKNIFGKPKNEKYFSIIFLSNFH